LGLIFGLPPSPAPAFADRRADDAAAKRGSGIWPSSTARSSGAAQKWRRSSGHAVCCGLGTPPPAINARAQTMLFMFVLMGRIGAGYMLAPFFIIVIKTVWSARHNPVWRKAFGIKAFAVVLVGTALSLAVIARNPSYSHSGQVFGSFWHRVITGITLGPSWPFGNLREVYKCERGGIPAGLDARNTDQHAHCIWWPWEPNRDRSASEVVGECLGPSTSKRCVMRYSTSSRTIRAKSWHWSFMKSRQCCSRPRKAY
jgi:hypothetical protein